MSGICPVCGCKTDDLDFVSCSFGGNPSEICSYCKKQIELLRSDSAGDNAASLRWLDGVLQKEVPQRKKSVALDLQRLYDRLSSADQSSAQPSEQPPEQPVSFHRAESVRPSAVPVSHATAAAPKTSADTQENPDTVIASLTRRLESLEKDYYRYRRHMKIQSIFEIVVPIILLIAIVIVFFKSGIYTQLKGLSNIYNQYFGSSGSVFGSRIGEVFSRSGFLL